MSEPAMNELTEPSEIIDVTPDLLERWLGEGDTILVDVREDFEHASERIEGAHHSALSSFDASALRQAHGAKRVVFHCGTGQRSTEAAGLFRNGDGHVFHLGGGLEAWTASGRSTRRSASAPRIGVMRQVQMTAGSLELAGVVLGVLVSPWFLGLSGFVGGGLFFAGASGWCGMARLLAHMPWNQVRSSTT